MFLKTCRALNEKLLVFELEKSRTVGNIPRFEGLKLHFACPEERCGEEYFTEKKKVRRKNFVEVVKLCFYLSREIFEEKNFFYFFRIRELFSESERKRFGLSGKKFSGRLSKLHSTCPFEYLKFCGIFLLW